MVKVEGKKEVAVSLVLIPQLGAPPSQEGNLWYDDATKKVLLEDDAGAREVISLDPDGKLPAVDASKLLNVGGDSFLFQPQGSPPATAEGKVYYLTTTDKLELYDATGWRTVISLDPDGKLPAEDGSKLTNVVGIVPVGGVIQWAKDIAGVPSLPANFQECDGTVISSGPMSGQNTPDYNSANAFPRGNTTSGGTGGATTHTHTVPATNLSYRNNLDASRNNYLTNNQVTSADSHLPPYVDMVFVMRIY